jgi:uncharacterized YccA/Bax inhibitor family protein
VRSSNPVLSGLGQAATRERAAGSGYGIYPPAGYGQVAPVAPGGTMTLDDVVVRTVGLLALTGLSGVAGAILLHGPLLALAMIGSMLAGLVLVLVISSCSAW